MFEHSKDKSFTSLHMLHPINLEEFWAKIKEEAHQVVEKESVLKPLIEQTILSQPNFISCISARLSRKLARLDMPQDEVECVLLEVLKENSDIAQFIAQDLQAIYDRDAACNSPLEPLLFFKGFHAITNYRISHVLWNNGRTALALYFQSIGSEIFQVDIHPAAKIGCGIMLDHATSFVVGETGIIEDNVSILHEVTLGGTGKQSGLRHPIVRSGVLIGAGTKILGRVEVGENAKIGAGSVVLNDVLPNTTVVGVPASVVGRSNQCKPALDME